MVQEGDLGAARAVLRRTRAEAPHEWRTALETVHLEVTPPTPDTVVSSCTQRAMKGFLVRNGPKFGALAVCP